MSRAPQTRTWRSTQKPSSQTCIKWLPSNAKWYPREGKQYYNNNTSPEAFYEHLFATWHKEKNDKREPQGESCLLLLLFR